MVWMVGFDPTASCTRNTRSAKLSYIQLKMVGMVGHDPTASCSQSRRSAIELHPGVMDKDG